MPYVLSYNRSNDIPDKKQLFCLRKMKIAIRYLLCICTLSDKRF
jgi:hypothetical protein